jgi:GT2 family glycosyltransferase
LDISVIIVTYNSAGCIRDCLESVGRQTGVAWECIVLDNASADGTVDVVRRVGQGVQVIANSENVGFGRANNQGADVAQGRLVYLLNPDAVLVAPGSLQRLSVGMERHPAWGLAGSRLLSAEGQEESAPSADYPGQRHVQDPPSGLPGSIAWVGGASLCIRREVYQQLNGFDPGFFLYSEETDLCLRARKMGHEIGLMADIVVRHIGGASEAGRDPYLVQQRRLAGLHRFWLKHYRLDDAVRVLRREGKRAAFRVAWYGVLQHLPRSGPDWAQKRRRYRATAELSARLLQALLSRSPAPSSSEAVNILDELTTRNQGSART